MYPIRRYVDTAVYGMGKAVWHDTSVRIRYNTIRLDTIHQSARPKKTSFFWWYQVFFLFLLKKKHKNIIVMKKIPLDRLLLKCARPTHTILARHVSDKRFRFRPYRKPDMGKNCRIRHIRPETSRIRDVYVQLCK